MVSQMAPAIRVSLLHFITMYNGIWQWVRSQTVEFYILNSQGLPAIVRQAAQRATPRLINRYSAGNNYF